MAIYEVVRTDYYVVEVNAKNKKEALKRCTMQDEFLNGGTFSESTFKVWGRR